MMSETVIYGTGFYRDLVERLVQRSSTCLTFVRIFCPSFEILDPELYADAMKQELSKTSASVVIIVGAIPVGTMSFLQRQIATDVLFLSLDKDVGSRSKFQLMLCGDVQRSNRVQPAFSGPLVTSIIQSDSFEDGENKSLQSAARLAAQGVWVSLLKNQELYGETVVPQFQQHTNAIIFKNALRLFEENLYKAGRKAFAIHGLRREIGLILRDSVDSDSTDRIENVIYFYDVDQPYGEFSNFSDHPILIEGVIWKTVEHYYQSQKFNKGDVYSSIRNAISPVRAKEIAQKNAKKQRSGWAQRKEAIMLSGLKAKFSQHPELTVLLINTDPYHIFEHSKNDSYWGDPGDGSGQNKLGKLLMEVRSNLLQRG